MECLINLKHWHSCSLHLCGNKTSSSGDLTVSRFLSTTLLSDDQQVLENSHLTSEAYLSLSYLLPKLTPDVLLSFKTDSTFHCCSMMFGAFKNLFYGNALQFIFDARAFLQSKCNMPCDCTVFWPIEDTGEMNVSSCSVMDLFLYDC